MVHHSLRFCIPPSWIELGLSATRLTWKRLNRTKNRYVSCPNFILSTSILFVSPFRDPEGRQDRNVSTGMVERWEYSLLLMQQSNPPRRSSPFKAFLFAIHLFSLLIYVYYLCSGLVKPFAL